MKYEWCDKSNNIYQEVLEEAQNQGFFERESYRFVNKVYHYGSYEQLRDALDWGMCMDEMLQWLILKDLFITNEQGVANHLAYHWLEFTPTGFNILISDVELYEKVVSPLISDTVLEKIAEQLDVEITDKGLQRIKTFEIPVQWIMTGTVKVDAANLDEAIEMVNNDEDRNGRAFALPTDSYYLEDSFEVSDTKERIIEYFL